MPFGRKKRNASYERGTDWMVFLGGVKSSELSLQTTEKESDKGHIWAKEETLVGIWLPCESSFIDRGGRVEELQALHGSASSFNLSCLATGCYFEKYGDAAESETALVFSRTQENVQSEPENLELHRSDSLYPASKCFFLICVSSQTRKKEKTNKQKNNICMKPQIK